MDPTQNSFGNDPTDPNHCPNFANLSLNADLRYYTQLLSQDPQNAIYPSNFGGSSSSTPGTAGSASNQSYQPFDIPTYSTQPDGVDETPDQQCSRGGRGRGRARGGGRARGAGRARGGASGGVARGGGGADGGGNPRVYWTNEDDLLLISGFLNTTTDPIVNTDQTANLFWARVEAYYMQWRKPHQAPRDQTRCKARWQKKINASVSKFVGCFEQATNQPHSGEGDADILKRAHQRYFEQMDKEFKEEHAWIALRDEPKWSIDYLHKINRSNTSSGSSKRSRSDMEGDTPTSVINEHPIERPMGIKAAKRKGKASASTSREDHVEILRVREQEQDVNFRLV